MAWIERARPVPKIEMTELGANGPAVKLEALTMPAAE